MVDVADFTFFLLTWNVMDTPPSDDYTNLLTSITSQSKHDFIVIGFQEIKFPNLFGEPWVESTKGALKNSDYVIVKKIQLVGILLIVVTKRELLPLVKNVLTTYVKTGLAGYWGNKGAVSIRLDIDNYPIALINSHLSAHDYNLFKRIKEYSTISQNLVFDLYKPPRQFVLDDHKLIIWLGDLNFRLEDIRVEEIVENINLYRMQPSNTKVIEYLLQFDQLGRTKRDLRAFNGYNEPAITFLPSYKMYPSTDEYDTNRKPSWCDRILYKLQDGSSTKVSTQDYNLHSNLKQSDHRPVSQTLKISIPASRQRIRRNVTFSRPRNWKANQDSLAFFSFAPNYRDNLSKKYDEVITANRSLDSNNPSDFDWVGLYNEDFTDIDEPLTYVWVNNEKLSELQSRSLNLLESFDESNNLPSTSTSGQYFDSDSSAKYLSWYKIRFLDLLIQKPGRYRLIYFNENNDVLGISDSFEIRP